MGEASDVGHPLDMFEGVHSYEVRAVVEATAEVVAALEAYPYTPNQRVGLWYVDYGSVIGVHADEVAEGVGRELETRGIAVGEIFLRAKPYMWQFTDPQLWRN